MGGRNVKISVYARRKFVKEKLHHARPMGVAARDIHLKINKNRSLDREYLRCTVWLQRLTLCGKV